MKVAVIIPDRNDRPNFLKKCLKMVENQTLKVDSIFLINEPAKDEKCDITYRYRTGYDMTRNKGFDLVFFMENDDWYAPDYIETVCNEWKKNPCNIIGTSYTIYYHIGLRKWMKLTHPHRSSAMSTALRADLNIDWGDDNYAYTDLVLWKQLDGRTFEPESIICLGIKHGTTMTGGKFHNDRFETYTNDDKNLEWLGKTINLNIFDEAEFDEMLVFYSQFYQNEKR
jgi:glycosyltransferase involved in cell wall biosynthesis